MTQQPFYKNRKFLKITFIVSLLLNFIIIGFAVSKVSHFAFSYSGLWYNEQISELKDEYKPIFKESRKEFKDIAKNFAVILKQETINEVDLEAVQQQFQAFSDENINHIQDIATDITKLPLETRLKMAKKIEKNMKRRHHHD